MTGCRMCGRIHHPRPGISDAYRIAWGRRELDMRCRTCGATSAASAVCHLAAVGVTPGTVDPGDWSCAGGYDLEYRSHAEQGSRPFWCETPLPAPAEAA